MLVLEYKLIASKKQQEVIGEALRVTQFIRNKALRLWFDDRSLQPFALNRYCAVLAKEYEFAGLLNSQARQAAAERAAYAIQRYLKPDVKGKKSAKPKFQKECRSVEYKITGWKLSLDRKQITFTDKLKIGTMKMLGTRDLCAHDIDLIKRVRILRRADGDYVQFCLNVNRTEPQEPTGKTIGLDMGLKYFYTDSNGLTVDCPKFLRQAEKKIKRAQRKHSRKVKGSSNRRKSKNILGRKHLKVQRQRKDFAIKLARCVVKSNDFVAIEDLQVRNMIKNHCLAKSFSDAALGMFSSYLGYYGSVFGKPVVKVAPHYTSQDCSRCGSKVWKSLSERTHTCRCGCVLDRDHNAALNILAKGLALDSRPFDMEQSYPGALGNEEDLSSKTLVESGPLPSS